MKKEFTFIISIMLFLLNGSSAQVKYEKEYRLNSKKIPQPALEFVNSLGFTRKVKWYKEEGIDRTSIEAKTKHRSQRYSVEFTPEGVIEDIEIKIRMKEVPEVVRQEIIKYLKTNHKKNKICKIQIQFSGDPDELINTIVNQSKEDNPKVKTHYELVVKVKNAKKHQKLEYLFNHKGEMVDKAVILLKNTDNLEY